MSSGNMIDIKQVSKVGKARSYADGRAKDVWPRELVVGLLPLLIGFNLLNWALYLPAGLAASGDFTTLYATGYMVRTHQGSDIQDDFKLAEVKEKIIPRKFSPQPMDHLGYEALLFVPLSFLSYKSAYITFIVINLGVLVFCSKVFANWFHPLYERWSLLPLFLCLAFFPITRAILQGQDSVILLGLLVGTSTYLRCGKEYGAGALTALGLFKLQIVIPIALMYLLWRRYRFVLGFAFSGGLMLLLN